MDEDFEDIEWEEVFFDGDLFVDDQRGKERHGAQIRVAFAYESQRHKALSADISDGGLFIATSHLLDQDTEFKLVFKLPTGSEPVRAIGRVAWIRAEPGEGDNEPVGFGVEFVTLADGGRESIDEYIELQSTLLMGVDDDE
jgi:uncharacterized protein (TIGR02266 family)